MLNMIKHLQYTDGKLKVDQHSVLNGFHNENLTVIYDRFTFLELKNDEKNYMLTYSIFCYSTPIAISLEMCPIPDIPLMGENIIIFSNQMFKVLIFEKTHITESYLIKFFVNIWNNGKNLEDLHGQNSCKNVVLV